MRSLPALVGSKRKKSHRVSSSPLAAIFCFCFSTLRCERPLPLIPVPLTLVSPPRPPSQLGIPSYKSTHSVIVNGWNYPCDARFKPWRVLKLKSFDPSEPIPKAAAAASPSAPSSAKDGSDGSFSFVLPPPAGFGDPSEGSHGRAESEEASYGSVVVADDVSYGGLSFLRGQQRSESLEVAPNREESVSPVNVSDSDDLAAVMRCLMERQDPADVALPPMRLPPGSARAAQLAEVGWGGGDKDTRTRTHTHSGTRRETNALSSVARLFPTLACPLLTAAHWTG